MKESIGSHRSLLRYTGLLYNIFSFRLFPSYTSFLQTLVDYEKDTTRPRKIYHSAGICYQY